MGTWRARELAVSERLSARVVQYVRPRRRTRMGRPTNVIKTRWLPKPRQKDWVPSCITAHRSRTIKYVLVCTGSDQTASKSVFSLVVRASKKIPR